MATEIIRIYRWPEVQAYLQERLAQLGRQLELAETNEEMWRLQGRARQLRELLNLPDTLSALKES